MYGYQACYRIIKALLRILLSPKPILQPLQQAQRILRSFLSKGDKSRVLLGFYRQPAPPMIDECSAEKTECEVVR